MRVAAESIRGRRRGETVTARRRGYEVFLGDFFFLMFGCKIKIMGQINREERMKRRSMQGGDREERNAWNACTTLESIQTHTPLKTKVNREIRRYTSERLLVFSSLFDFFSFFFNLGFFFCIYFIGMDLDW